jgi:hypothetical protein
MKMQRYVPVTGPKDPESLTRLERNLRGVLENLREKVLEHGLTFEEHFRGEVLEWPRAEDPSLTAPLSDQEIPLDASFPGAPGDVLFLGAVADTGARVSGCSFTWEPITIGTFQGIRVSSISGLSNGVAYRLRLLVLAA